MPAARRLLLLLTLALLSAPSLALLSVPSLALAVGSPHAGLASACAPSVKSATLQQQLESGLRARRPEEFAFIDRVVKMVNLNQLPETLVRSTFDWARDKRPYPFPYFERGLKVRAARLGIDVR